MRLLSDLLTQCSIAVPESVIIPDYSITDFSADSRNVKKDGVFIAIPGHHTDGHDYIPHALDMGVRVVFFERAVSEAVRNKANALSCLLIKVPFARKTLSAISAYWNGYPENRLCLIGVTGTDGKSSTVYFTHQLLELAGTKSGFFSTVAMQTADSVVPNSLRQSTPEAPELHKVLSEMVNAGKTHAVIETTSHGLSEKTARLADMRFTGGIFTNLSHEHLEFHGSFEQYRFDKANLFRNLREKPEAGSPSPFAVINFSDHNAEYFIQACKHDVLGYAVESLVSRSLILVPRLYARNVRATSDNTHALLVYDRKETPVSIPLPGTFNIENVMAAMLAASRVLGCSPIELVPLLKSIKGVKGRMLPVRLGQPFSVVIDYAHTPGAYEKVFPMFRQSTKGRLIAVFGSAGERDTEKRPIQGRIAALFSNILVLTNEDPRLEPQNLIIEEIKKGAVSASPEIDIHCIPDRRAAIALAFAIAVPGDLVVLLGKGHEQSIIYPDGKRAWDEESVAIEELNKLGWGGSAP